MSMILKNFYRETYRPFSRNDFNPLIYMYAKCVCKHHARIASVKACFEFSGNLGKKKSHLIYKIVCKK